MRRTLLAAFVAGLSWTLPSAEVRAEQPVAPQPASATVAQPGSGQPPSGTQGQIEDDTDMVHDDDNTQIGAKGATTSATSATGTNRNPVRRLQHSGGRITIDRSHASGAAMAPEDYQGVRLDGQGLPPKAPHLPLKSGPQRLTWSGFQIKDGVPTVFVQVTSAPDYSITDDRGRVNVRLKNTTVKLRNNLRPLDVGEFGTQVSSIVSKKAGSDTLVTISTRDAAAPAHREHVEASAGGFQLLVIELPANGPLAAPVPATTPR